MLGGDFRSSLSVGGYAGFRAIGLLVILGFTTLAFASCRTPDPLPDRRVVEIWNRNEQAVEKAIGGYQKDDEFLDACTFFERVTGIEIHVNMFTLGVLPEPEAKDDLKKIRAWFAANRDRLYWDEMDRSVRVKPSTGGLQ